MTRPTESDLARILAGLTRVEDSLQKLAAKSLSADHIDRLAEQSEQLRREIEVARRTDSASRLLAVEQELREQVGILRQHGDQWLNVISPELKAGGLRDINLAIDRMTSQLRLAAAVVAVCCLLLLVAVIIA